MNRREAKRNGGKIIRKGYRKKKGRINNGLEEKEREKRERREEIIRENKGKGKT